MNIDMHVFPVEDGSSVTKKTKSVRLMAAATVNADSTKNRTIPEM